MSNIFINLYSTHCLIIKQKRFFSKQVKMSFEWRIINWIENFITMTDDHMTFELSIKGWMRMKNVRLMINKSPRAISELNVIEPYSRWFLSKLIKVLWSILLRPFLTFFPLGCLDNKKFYDSIFYFGISNSTTTVPVWDY